MQYLYNRMIFINKKNNMNTCTTRDNSKKLEKFYWVKENLYKKVFVLNVLLYFYDIQVNAYQIFSEQQKPKQNCSVVFAGEGIVRLQRQKSKIWDPGE